MYNTPITLANIYFPDFDNEKFIASVLVSLPNLHTHNLLLAGDFNFVMDAVLDRSSSKQHSLTKSAKILQKFFKSTNIIHARRYTKINENILFSLSHTSPSPGSIIFL